MNDQFLSNTYLVGDRPGGVGVLIDAGGPVAPLLERIDEHELTVGHVLLTHHHHDHVCALDEVLGRHPDATVLIHPLEREQVQGATGTMAGGERVPAGDLEIEALHTPGHTAGMLSLLVSEREGMSAASGRAEGASAASGRADAASARSGRAVFTGDTLFKGSVGGVRATGHTTYADLKESIMSRLMALAPDVAVHPGHTDPTTIGDEWEENPFIRVWRGLDAEGDERCTALGEPAILILLADDYDGGKKAWVRWPDGSDDIVPGSQVRLAGSR